MLLIVYGSFRSLNMEREARERAEKEREASLLGGKPTTTSSSNNSECFISPQCPASPSFNPELHVCDVLTHAGYRAGNAMAMANLMSIRNSQ